ncbi:type II secretion system secretin GspD [Leclercia sp. LTM14]|uniref:Type II secretion system secretin GspD n=2 Tax=Enterobacteriaceae TaxID=543 RepID=A0ABS7S0J2_9ENTR|nr:type II secretion system secretin GspD [Leclercia sp. EMC7]MCM5702091.1 type II secretion system secretin GspD [Leclercia sp. LTM14]
MSLFIRRIAHGLILLAGLMPAAWGASYSASFKSTDVQEFINIVSKNLHKTIIIDPAVRGVVNVRSYDALNDEQYFQFFLSVLDVYGFAVVPGANGVLKVVKSAAAKTGAIALADDYHAGTGDEVVTRVISVANVDVKELAPLLRQLNDNAGAGNVVHYESANVLLVTGRAGVVNRLAEIVRRVDRAGNQQSDIIKLKYASSPEMASILNGLSKNDRSGKGASLVPGVVADQRTNSLVISGSAQGRQRLIAIARQLDREEQNQGNTRVFYLKFAQAKNLVSVLTGANSSVPSKPGGEKSSTAPGASSMTFSGKEVSIVADEQTNSLVITTQLDTMQALEQIINRLDIRRAQVLIEAVIVEMQDGDALNFGVQWFNKNGGTTQFTGTGLPVSSVVAADGQRNAASLLSSFNGIAAGFYSGDWAGLVTALANNSRSNILATPSIVTLDNKEAAINVGQEVPVITGSQASSTGSVYNTVERKTVGTRLKVVPQINDGESVLLNIEQEVSSVASASSAESSSAGSNLGATFNTRTINNAVIVRSGETVVLGGLLNNQTTESVSKVPILGDIPLLGYLFRYNSTSTSKQNLMVFIHPVILRDGDSYRGISNEKYHQFRDEQRSDRLSHDPLALPTPDLTLPATPGTRPRGGFFND